MDIVKLDNRHKIVKFGFSYALRFPYYNNEAHNIAGLLRKWYGEGYTGFSWQDATRHQWSGAMSSKFYYIAVREESMITEVLLSLRNDWNY